MSRARWFVAVAGKQYGPGRVRLQSLPFSRLADRIWRAAPQTGGKHDGEGSILGGLVS